jgi:protein KRI1
LKPEEIFMADDKDLNEYLSLKKLAPFRNQPRDVEWLAKWSRGSKSRRRDFRKKLKQVLAVEAPEAVCCWMISI